LPFRVYKVPADGALHFVEAVRTNSGRPRPRRKLETRITLNEKAEALIPDLVLLDFLTIPTADVMPGMNGIDVAMTL